MTNRHVKLRCAALLALATLVGAVAGMPAAPASAAGRKFLLYDLNAGEGFNLRRDAMMRMAMLVRDLGPEWTLVLPPFHRMVHWKTDTGRERLPWSTFFDLSHLGEVVRVMEYEDYAKAHGDRVDRVVHLTTGAAAGSAFRLEPRDCAALGTFTQKFKASSGGFTAPFFGGTATVETPRVDCEWILGPYPTLEPYLDGLSGSSVLVDGVTTMPWDARAGGPLYWKLRTRLPFAPSLTAEPERFIRATFGGAPYLAFHLRRGDFIRTPRPHPTLDEVVAQVRQWSKATGISRVFLATDGSPEDVAYLKERIAFERYTPPAGDAYSDGVLAIFDQIIASRAATFVGTSSSTFTNEIFEEREILGKDPAATYNVLCTAGESTGQPGTYRCPAPARMALVR